jgi:hypothetical protein
VPPLALFFVLFSQILWAAKQVAGATELKKRIAELSSV